MQKNEINSENMEALTLEIIEFLQQNQLFQDVNIFCNNKRFSSNYSAGSIMEKTQLGIYYVMENRNAADVVEFNNPNTITMTFEGPLYHVLNYGPEALEQKFLKVFEKYGLYYELGYAWSLATYPI